MSVFLIVLSAVGGERLQIVWRVCFGMGILLPMTVFYFRIRMLTSQLFRKGAIKRRSISITSNILVGSLENRARSV